MTTQGGAQFTLGPWIVKSTDEDINTKTIIDSNEFWIAKVLNFNHASDDVRESQANARLIAAAPAMYEALKELLECNELCADVDSLESRTITRIRAGQAALAQAEGRGDT